MKSNQKNRKFESNPRSRNENHQIKIDPFLPLIKDPEKKTQKTISNFFEIKFFSYLISDLTKSRSIKIRTLSINFPDLGKEKKKLLTSLSDYKVKSFIYTYTYKVFLGA